MRVEYGFELSQVDVPRFSVQAEEEIGKLFTLATLVLNVLESRPKVEIVFHGVNAEDPERKIQAFQEILTSSESGAGCAFEMGAGDRVSASYFRWLRVRV